MGVALDGFSVGVLCGAEDDGELPQLSVVQGFNEQEGELAFELGGGEAALLRFDGAKLDGFGAADGAEAFAGQSPGEVFLGFAEVLVGDGQLDDLKAPERVGNVKAQFDAVAKKLVFKE